VTVPFLPPAPPSAAGSSNFGGTLAWSAPELLLGSHISHRSDVYSMGVVSCGGGAYQQHPVFRGVCQHEVGLGRSAGCGGVLSSQPPTAQAVLTLALDCQHDRRLHRE